MYPAVAADDAIAGPTPPSDQAQALQEVVVTGSRIPRTSLEGPAPVVTISADDILKNGFGNVSDIMTALTQNLGALDNNQYTNGFTPGAQAVDLRGLGPNHTLVLVNGRRIADYPQAYGGNSNFTDISSIPTSIIDHIEILSGSASAVYGSDAISGVINFILKKKAEGTSMELRGGATQHGGGASERFSISSGYNTDRLDSVFALELVNQSPLWAYQRDFTRTRLASPAAPSKLYPGLDFVRMDVDENYIDPGAATCNALSSLNHGSIIYANRVNWGAYCGSYYDIGYGTLVNARKAANFYGSATYHLSDSVSLFLDIQAGISRQKSYKHPLKWQNSYPLNGDSTPVPFYNQATGQVEQWQREYFTLEEEGGFDAATLRNNSKTLSLNTGIKGTIGDTNWNYEALFGHSQNQLESITPGILSAKAQALYLGPSLGTDPDSGYEIYNAPVSRLYTPLTPAEFASISQASLDNDRSRAEVLSLTANNTRLFDLPAGPVGVAAVAEYGYQHFAMRPDPLSLDGSYYGYHNTGAVGSRHHTGLGMEFSVPVFTQLNWNLAGRYDSYRYGPTTAGKFTYSTGLEYRPVRSLLLRGSFGTGFRAPDLTYLFAGMSGSSSGGTDYYLCRRDEPGTAPDFADNCSNGDIGFNGRSYGSTALKDETSTSFTAGIVFAPFKAFMMSVDYYRIKLSNEVEYQESDTILREEADCRLGRTTSGAPVDINSGLCQQVLSQVVRNPASDLFNPEGVTSVLVLPINAAVDKTSGIDINAHYLLETARIGKFDFNLDFTNVLDHTIQLFPGDPAVSELSDWYNYVIPRNKGTFSTSWEIGHWTTTVHVSRLGGIPNYDGTARLAPTSMYNASLVYRFNNDSALTFVVDNLLDTKPKRDATWTAYPYYSRNWFSAVGRAFSLQFNYRFGGPGT
ncbi:MAG: TonB-dependent receptor [Proteobacteria bacterium]|nr:TonB-dependent receptor [Pseudomonadota bacterium]